MCMHTHRFWNGGQKEEDVQDRARRTESDNLNQLSFPRLVRDCCVFVLKYMQRKATHTFFFCLHISLAADYTWHSLCTLTSDKGW